MISYHGPFATRSQDQEISLDPSAVDDKRTVSKPLLVCGQVAKSLPVLRTAVLSRAKYARTQDLGCR